MSDPTCVERIAFRAQSRANHASALFSIIDNDEIDTVDDEELDADTAYDRLAELPLSIEMLRTVKILLSTGGPADWLEVQLYDDTTPRRITYHFADWFDHAQIDVDKDSPLWRLGEYYIEFAQPLEVTM